MADAKEKDEALTSNSNPETDAAEKASTPANIPSTSNPNLVETGIVSGETDKIDEEVEVNDEHEGKAIVEAIAEEELDEEDALSEEEMNEEDEEKAEEKNNGMEVEGSPKGKGRKPRKRNKKKKAAQKASEIVAVDGNKPESSKKKKASKRVESMGMVFMCSSETKGDCFRYKILGLPASKKDQVAKIYKGMRLFLFDVDLRLMYGIFKAAGPGGYNIEPKAFKSAFPSQVRFTVFEDCLPLAEENFKQVLKENYYTRNKFECQLNAEQVKKLCKLFVIPGKSLKPALKSGRSRADENHRSRAGDDRSRADAYTSRDREKRKRRAREEERRPHSPSARERRRYHDYERAPVRYEREVLASPVDPSPRYLPLPSLAPAPPLRSFGYERAMDMHPYLREPVVEQLAYHVLDTEPRRRGDIANLDRDRDRERERERDRDRDPYLLYRREPSSYRDTVYTSIGQTADYHHRPAAALPPEYRLASRDYHPSVSAVQPAEYRLSGGLHAPDYRSVGLTSGYPSSASSLPEYRSLRTHYRY